MVFTVVVWLLCIVAWVAAVVLFLRLNRLQIHEIQVAGNRSVDSEQVQEIAREYLDGFKYGLIPNRSYFTYPAALISETIVKEIPRVGSVQLVRHKDVLSVNVNERVPAVVVCDASSAGSASKPCLFSDDNAFLYSEAPSQSSKIYVEYIVSTSTGFEIGKPFMDVKQFYVLKSLSEGITKLGLFVSKIKITATGDLTIITNQDTTILVKHADSYNSTLSNLALFLEKAKQQARSKKEPLKISSIDLRYGNSVFYKSNEN